MSFLQRASDKLWPMPEDQVADLGDEEEDGNGAVPRSVDPVSVGLDDNEIEAMRAKFWGG